MRPKQKAQHPIKRMFMEAFRHVCRKLSPVLYVKTQYKYVTGHKLNLDNPIRYTEKLQHLRLYEYPNDPLVRKCASRLGGREYVQEKGYGESLIAVLAVRDSFSDIDFSILPESYVLKCNHASGFNQVVFDNKTMDYASTKKKFDKWMKTDYGKMTVEPHYVGMKRCILIEQLLLENGDLPTEYKIHCFNGKAKNLYVVRGRGKDIRYDQLYIDWTPFDESQFNGWKKSDVPPTRPSNFDKMIKMAEDLAKPFPFVRVDLYSIDGKIYFSELTFTPAKGTLRFDDDNADFIQGEWLTLPKNDAK